MAITQKSRWDDAGVEPPAGEARYVAGEQPIAEYDNWFNKAVVDDIAALNAWLDNLGITKVYIDVEANMPASGKTTELFIATDTNKIYRGTGTGWQELTVDWNAILNKPSYFPPEAHTHGRSEITDFFASPFWDNIPDKPSTFPPSAHDHSGDTLKPNSIVLSSGSRKIELQGPNGSFVLSCQDGSGRLHIYWNAYYDGTYHRFIQAGDYAGWLLINSDGKLYYRRSTTPAANAGDIITWGEAVVLGDGVASNADMVDGKHASDLLDKATYDSDNDGIVEKADYATNAGNADTVDGMHASDFAAAVHNHGLTDITIDTDKDWGGYKIYNVNCKDYVISDDVYYKAWGPDNPYHYTTSNTYVKIGQFILPSDFPQNTMVRFVFDAKVSLQGDSGDVRLRKNSTVVATYTVTSTSPVRYVKDITVSANDVVEIWAKSNTSREIYITYWAVHGSCRIGKYEITE